MAWTFQEEVFSQRLLVLQNNSATWECHCAVWVEDILMEAGKFQSEEAKRVVADGLHFAQEPSLYDDKHVEDHSRRQLS